MQLIVVKIVALIFMMCYELKHFMMNKDVIVLHESDCALLCLGKCRCT